MNTPLVIEAQRIFFHPAIVAALVSVSFLSGCDNSPPQQMEKPDPLSQQSQLPPASPETKPSSPLPDEFRRFQYNVEGRDGLDIELNAEEVISGVRLQTEVSDAESGEYVAVFHEIGNCEGLDPAKLGPSMDLMTTGKQMKGPNGENLYHLGDLKVDSAGNGHGRWLTAVGNLRENQAKSLLKGAFVLYRAESNELGRVMACVPVEDREG